jgi:HPt (histidine-containing phosphotransfer) domain-containing protein
MAAARAAWERGDIDAAASDLHNLRGALGTVGAKRFMRLSLALEGALRDGAAGVELAALFGQAGQEVERTVAAGSAWLASVRD